MTTVRGRAGTLCVQVGGWGVGVPIVFLHSLAGTAAQWRAQLEHFRTGRRVLAPELRGHGGSEPPADGDYSIAAMADDVAAVVERLEVERFLLVGHSLGGHVAIAYAGQHAEHLAGLVLVDPAGDQRQATETEPFLRLLDSDAFVETIEGYWMVILEGAAPHVKRRVLADLRATPKEVVVSALRGLTAFLERSTGARR